MATSVLGERGVVRACVIVSVWGWVDVGGWDYELSGEKDMMGLQSILCRFS